MTATEVFERLQADPDAVLLDVRTMAEWNWVGVPLAANARFVQWATWPGGQPNPNFVEEAIGGLAPSTPIYVICRSGGRSAAAAEVLAAHGFTNLTNVSDGFEGDLDNDGHRTGGWKGAGLPWKQG